MKTITLFTILLTFGTIIFKGAESTYHAFNTIVKEASYTEGYEAIHEAKLDKGAMVSLQLQLSSWLQPVAIFVLSLGLPVFIILVLVFILCIVGLYQFINPELKK